MAKLIPDNLKSRSDIRHAIRKVASAMEALPPDAVVWYEPLFDTTGEKPDFVVWLPDRGIAVLEVLDAKVEGIIGFKRGKVQLIRDGTEVKIENPISRAAKFAEKLSKMIAAEPRLSQLGIHVAPGACLPLLSQDELDRRHFGEEFASSFTIFREDLDDERNGQELLSAFERLLGKARFSDFSSAMDKLVRGIVQPDIVINRVAQSKEDLQIFQQPEVGNDVIRVMDRDQESLAKSLGDGHRIIRGVAGSGKTLVLMYRAKLLARCNPRLKYLVLCYTKALAGQLRRLLEDFPNVDIVHLDKLAWDLSGGEAARSSKTGNNYDAEAVIGSALKAVETGRGSRYDGILVDEAQDLNTEALVLVTKLLKPGCDDLIIVADAAQNIFRRKFSWKQAGIQAQGRTRMLRVNYRNTREILEFASAFLLGEGSEKTGDITFDDENSLIPPESSKRTGSPPKLVFVPNVVEEVNETVRVVQDELCRLKQGQKIAVLYPGADGKDRGYWLNRRMMESGIEHFWVKKEESSKTLLGAAKEHVLLCTVQSSKGLEFPRVVLCGTWWEGGDADVNRKLSYVAMTRATDYLVVVTRSDNGFADELRRASGTADVAPIVTPPNNVENVQKPSNDGELISASKTNADFVSQTPLTKPTVPTSTAKKPKLVKQSGLPRKNKLQLVAYIATKTNKLSSADIRKQLEAIQSYADKYGHSIVEVYGDISTKDTKAFYDGTRRAMDFSGFIVASMNVFKDKAEAERKLAFFAKKDKCFIIVNQEPGF